MDYLNYNKVVLYKRSKNLIKLLYLSFFALLWQNTTKAQDVLLYRVPIGNIDINGGRFDLNDWHAFNDLIAYDFFVRSQFSLNSLPVNEKQAILSSSSRTVQLVPTTEHGRVTLGLHPYAKGEANVGIWGNNVGATSPIGALSGNALQINPLLPNFGQSFNKRIVEWNRANFNDVPLFVDRTFYDNVAFPRYMRANFEFRYQFSGFGSLNKAIGKSEIKVNTTLDNTDYFFYDGNKPFQQYSYNFVNNQYDIIESITSQRSDLTFGTANLPNLSAVQVNSAKGYELFTFNNNNNFSGVDFTNLQVSGLDVDSATGMVNFILKGDQTSGNGTNLAEQESFNKKLFLQALTVPTGEWFVSLDTNPSPTATATTAFKQTDMADLFFKADVELKKDMFTFFYNGQGDIPVITKWFQILAASNPNMLNNLVNRGVNIVPNLTIRGVIVPQLVNNDQLTGKMNIDDSFYTVNITFPNASINTGVAALSAEETAFLNGTNWTTFVNWLNVRRDQVSAILRDRINGSVLPNYKKLKDILPVLVAAKWYKDAPANIIPNKQFAYLINKKLTGTSAPGVNLTQSVSWDQNYWNGQANQLLGSVSVNVASGSNNISGVFDITGGVDLYAVTLANASMNSVKESRNSAVLSSNFINQNGSYVNGGSQRLNLPNLVADNIYIDPSTNPDIPIGTFSSNETLNFSFDVRNLGLSNLPSTSQIYLRVTNLVTNVTTTYSLNYTNALAPNTSDNLSISLSNIPPSKYRMVVVLDPGNLITESNEQDNNIAIEYIVIQNQDCSGGGVTYSAAINANNLDIASCKITLQGGLVSLTGNGNLTALHNGVFLKDGFKYTATASSSLKAKSVFAYTNAVSNLYNKGSKTKADDIVHDDLNAASQNENSVATKFDVKSEKIAVSKINEEVILDSNLTKEIRNYIQQSEYSSIYTITTQPQIQEVTEDPIPDDITALRNIKDNIQTLQINYTDEKVNKPEFWTVAPNPANEYFEISFNSVVDEVVSAQLFDLNGKKVMDMFQDLKINKGITKKSIDISTLNSGMYIINLETKGNIHTSRMIIKNKIN